jgi:hypothetical protein
MIAIDGEHGPGQIPRIPDRLPRRPQPVKQPRRDGCDVAGVGT